MTTGPEPTTPAREYAHELEDRMVAALAPAEIAAFIVADGVEQVLEDGIAEVVLEEWEGPHDLDTASWASRHLARRRQKIASVKALAAEQRFRVNEWEAHETRALEADARFFEGRLRAFHEHALATDPRAKTIALPDGAELRSQAGKLAVEVDDLEAFALWCEQNELALELLRLADPEPNKTAIAKRFSAKAENEKEPGEYPAVVADSGETVPGVKIVRKPRTYTVSTEQ